MQLRVWILLTAVWIASGLSCLQPASAAPPARQPNILFLFADDLCFDTVHALGNGEIHTPNLDALVRRGTTFRHAYNMGGWHGAICVASRTMLATGRYLWHARAVEKNLHDELAAGRLWPASMRRAGYRTCITGKWHVAVPAAEAFDIAAHVRGGMPGDTPEGYNRPLEGQPDTWNPSDPRFGGFWKGGRHWSAVVADDAVGFIEHAARSEQPYFMYVTFNAPHDPSQAPQEFVDMYPADKLRVPASFLPEYPFKDSIGCSPNLRDEKLAPFPRTEHAVQVHRREYYASISYLDQQLGRILEALEKSGEADNTWIFFTADHGLAVGHHGLMGKQNMYDDSVRVPFLAIGPGVAAGRTIDTPIYLQDVMPTVLEIADVAKPAHVEFHSLLPLLHGESRPPREAIYGAYMDLQRMVTLHDHKLILYPQIARARLFNLKDDPHEMRDLAGDATHAATIRKLFTRLLDLQKQTGDPLDLRAAFPNL